MDNFESHVDFTDDSKTAALTDSHELLNRADFPESIDNAPENNETLIGDADNISENIASDEDEEHTAGISYLQTYMFLDDEDLQDSNIENDTQANISAFVVDTETTEDSEAPAKLLRLPISRIRAIAKLVPSVQLINSEAIFLIGRATEQFIVELITETKGVTLESGKKTITRTHVDQVVQQYSRFEFLDTMLS